MALTLYSIANIQYVYVKTFEATQRTLLLAR